LALPLKFFLGMADLYEYQEAFAYFDRDRDGRINGEEFGRVLRAVGHAPTEAELAAMRKAIDKAYGGRE
jgi:Ca2+-binding EF-hand superfamily protein